MLFIHYSFLFLFQTLGGSDPVSTKSDVWSNVLLYFMFLFIFIK